METGPIKTAVVDEIHAELGRQRKSVYWLSQQLGYSYTRVRNRLSDDAKLPASDAIAIARVLNVQPSAFFEVASERIESLVA